MIVIDPSKGGNDIGISSNGIVEKDFNLLISNYIYTRLKDLGAEVKIIRNSDENLSTSERANRIINSYGDNSKVVALSNRLSNSGNDVEIIYALRNKDTLAKSISDNLESSNIKVNKYYQKRNENDTSKDYYDIQSLTNNIETLVIDYGNINNIEEANNLKNDYKKYAEAVIKAIANYKNIPYYLEGQEDNLYIVKKGDSLYSIANKFDTTVNNIKNINNLKNNLLSIGQKIKIPLTKTSQSQQTYIVQSGDNLYSIANKFDTTVNELKNINNLTSNLLSINQKLKIPNNIKENIYVVKKGDSLYSIANKYNTTVNNIKNINNLNSNLLSIGQQLKISN